MWVHITREEKTIPQRLRELSETDKEFEGFVQVALQKRKATTQVALTPKRPKTVQPTPAIRESVIPSTIPKRIKTRATKANPKFGEKEWTVSFTGNKENFASSSSNSESTDETLISPLQKCPVPIPKQCPPPSHIHLKKFTRSTLQKEPLTKA